jgi:hypothetical protein
VSACNSAGNRARRLCAAFTDNLCRLFFVRKKKDVRQRPPKRSSKQKNNRRCHTQLTTQDGRGYGVLPDFIDRDALSFFCSPFFHLLSTLARALLMHLSSVSHSFSACAHRHHRSEKKNKLRCPIGERTLGSPRQLTNTIVLPVFRVRHSILWVVENKAVEIKEQLERRSCNCFTE